MAKITQYLVTPESLHPRYAIIRQNLDVMVFITLGFLYLFDISNVIYGLGSFLTPFKKLFVVYRE
jgi:hypothetical protein